MLRLLYLQREIHRAVRGRHREASIMLARASVETLLTGLWCRPHSSQLMDPGGGIVPGPDVEQASRAAVSPGAASFGSFGKVGWPLASAPRSRKSVRSLALASR
jgi:hypothetical protein